MHVCGARVPLPQERCLPHTLARSRRKPTCMLVGHVSPAASNVSPPGTGLRTTYMRAHTLARDLLTYSSLNMMFSLSVAAS